MTILDYVSKLNISLTDEQEFLLIAWEKSYIKNEKFVVSMSRYCGGQALSNLINQYTAYCQGWKEAGEEIGTNLLNAIFDKKYGVEKHNLWLISQINHYCFGMNRICDIHAKEDSEGEDVNGQI